MTTMTTAARATDAAAIVAAIEAAEGGRGRLTITVDMARDEDNRRGWAVFVNGDQDGDETSVCRSWQQAWRCASLTAQHARDLGFCVVIQL